MKKFISVLLAVLIVASGIVPCVSAEIVTPLPGTVHVRLVLPSSAFYKAYSYVKTLNGQSVLYPDPTGEYVYSEADGAFVNLSSLMFSDEKEAFASYPHYACAEVGDYEAYPNGEGKFICPNGGQGIPGDDRNYILCVDGLKYYYEPYLIMNEENKDMYATEPHFSIRQYNTYEAYLCAGAGYVLYELDAEDMQYINNPDNNFEEPHCYRSPIHDNQSSQEFSFYYYEELPPCAQLKCSYQRFEIFSYRNVTVTEPTDFVFHMVTNSIYNATTAYLYVGGTRVEPTQNGQSCKMTGGVAYQYNSLGEYVVHIDPTNANETNNIVYMYIREKDDFGNDILLRNNFSVVLPSGEGFKAKPVRLENNAFVSSPNYYVPYGDDFYFCVKITKGYTAAGMTVETETESTAESQYNGQLEVLGEIMEVLGPLLEKLDGTAALNENLFSAKPIGTDTDGNQVYCIKNITKNNTVKIDGVEEESKSNIMAVIKRVLVLICDFLNIEVPEFILKLAGVSITTYGVTFDASCDAAKSQGVTYKVMNPSADVQSNDDGSTSYIFCGSETMSVKVTKQTAEQNVRVEWGNYNKDTGLWEQSADSATFQSQWKAQHVGNTDAFTYTATYYITVDTDMVVRFIVSE